MNRKVKILNVFFHDIQIGKLVSDNAQLSFQYDELYLESKNSRYLSTSLPLQKEPFTHATSSSFFSGLLPDELVRKRLAQYLRISEQNTFALLQEIGGECAGAISLYPEGQTPETKTKPSYRILTNMEASDILSSIHKRPMMIGENDIRISGAGAQDKLIITLINGKIAIPLKNAPSTHIIKPTIHGLKDTVFNEFFCMKLAQSMGLPTPEVYIHWLNNEPYYLIERYDRKNIHDGQIIRLHQEDFCQALQIPPEHKYQDEGGPSLQDCFSLLDHSIKSGRMAGINKLILLRGVIFNYLIGNGDAHGKNFSLLYDGEMISFAPFYDLMSTMIYTDEFKEKMAMKIANNYKFRNVLAKDFDKLADQINFKQSLVQKEIKKMSESIVTTATVLQKNLNKNPKTASPIYDDIISALSKQLKNL